MQQRDEVDARFLHRGDLGSETVRETERQGVVGVHELDADVGTPLIEGLLGGSNTVLRRLRDAEPEAGDLGRSDQFGLVHRRLAQTIGTEDGRDVDVVEASTLGTALHQGVDRHASRIGILVSGRNQRRKEGAEHVVAADQFEEFDLCVGQLVIDLVA